LADSECQANQFADLRQMKSLQPCELMAAKIKQMARFELIHTVKTHFGYFNDLRNVCKSHPIEGLVR